MNAGRHIFTIARDWPATITHDVEAIETQQARLSELRQLARTILEAGTYPAEWTNAAQWLADTGDDAADLEWLIEQDANTEAFERQCEAYQERTGKDWSDSAELCAIEAGLFNAEPWHAAVHLAAMPADRLAELNSAYPS